jgi:hypothetical protein
LWHLPSFAFPGAAIPSFFTVGAWSIFLFLCSIMAESFIFTYVYLKTRGNLVLAILLHMALNARSNIAEGFFPTLQNANAARERIYITDFALITVWAAACFVFDRAIKPKIPATGSPETQTDDAHSAVGQQSNLPS